MSFALLRPARDQDASIAARVLTILDSAAEATAIADELREQGLTIEVWRAEGHGPRIRLSR